MEKERVLWHLYNWADWMRSNDEKTKIEGRMNCDWMRSGASNTFDEMARKNDVDCAKIFYVCILDLSKNLSEIIHYYWLQQKIANDRNDDENYEKALLILGKAASRKNLL